MFKWCSDTWINVMAAPLTSVSAASRNPVKFGSDQATAGADGSVPIAPLHDGLKAGVIIVVFVLKLLEGVFSGHGTFSYD